MSAPNATQIATALRTAVQKQFALDGNVIPSVMRARVEAELGLGADFFKEDAYWKAQAKSIIKAEFEALTEAEAEVEEPAPEKKKKSVVKKTAPAAVKVTAKKAAAKKARKGDDDDEAAIEEAEEAAEEQAAGDKSPAKKAASKAAPKKAAPKKAAAKRAKAKPTVEDDDDAETEAAAPPAPAAQSESELSELEDELAKKPAKRARATASTAGPKRPTPKRAKAKPTVPEESSDEEAAAPAAAAVDGESKLSEAAGNQPKKKPAKRSLGADDASPKKKAKVTPKASPQDSEPAEVEEEEEEADPERPTTPVPDDAGSDSEMSVVLDPTPQKGRSTTKKVPALKKTKSPKAPSGRKTKAKKTDSKEDTPLDPEQEQLKNLKAWLLKCGIRKIWSRELAKYDTPRAQITYLKNLLTEVGMTGRYSAEKAKKIKEDRELRAEVEAVQLGAGDWGKDDQGAAAGKRKVSTRSMRNAPAASAAAKKEGEKKEIRGREEFAFLDDQSDSD